MKTNNNIGVAAHYVATYKSDVDKQAGTLGDANKISLQTSNTRIDNEPEWLDYRTNCKKVVNLVKGNISIQDLSDEDVKGLADSVCGVSTANSLWLMRWKFNVGGYKTTKETTDMIHLVDEMVMEEQKRRGV